VIGASASVIATPYTVSGTTLTLGTAATATSGNTNGSTLLRTYVNSNGNIVAEYINTTHFATVFKLTTTTEAASSISLGATVPAGTITGGCDAIDLTGGKTLFMTSASNTFAANILTDTAGTASAGTELTVAVIGVTSVVALFGGASTARVLLYGIYSGGSSNEPFSSQINLNTSGASPSVSSAQNTVGATLAIAPPTDRMGIRSPLLMRTGAVAYSLPVAVTAQQINLDALLITAGSIYRMKKPPSGARPAWTVGASDIETWLGNGFGSVQNGLHLTKLECAA
jgi:hypothetical protein